MHAYSMDLRQRVLADTDRGLPTRAVATKYSVSESWVRRLKQRRRETGEVAPRAADPGPAPSWEADADRLREAVAQTPDATLAYGWVHQAAGILGAAETGRRAGERLGG